MAIPSIPFLRGFRSALLVLISFNTFGRAAGVGIGDGNGQGVNTFRRGDANVRNRRVWAHSQDLRDVHFYWGLYTGAHQNTNWNTISTHQPISAHFYVDADSRMAGKGRGDLIVRVLCVALSIYRGFCSI